ncbi:MAG TPA: PDZ domain-containing protein, partial [Campylobacterales bacterium]|nr:PDZ domain-containing protein [Campylobacterales bacterium]
LERLRLSTTASLLHHEDVIVIASVSANYGLGSPDDYRSIVLKLVTGEEHNQKALLLKLVDMGYKRNDEFFDRGDFRVTGEVIDIYPAYSEEFALRLEFAEFSEYIEDNLMIISGCCVTAGLSIGGKKFIDANYIKHFIETDNAHLSDIGARFIEIDKRIFVKSVNPFFTDNPFLENDEILYIDNEPIQSIDKFLQNILFSPQNRVIDFEILRGNQLVEISVETSILKGGGFLSDTFLENIGVWLDESLFVTNVHKESAFAKKGLRNSYRLLSINGENLKNEDEIRKFLSSLKADIPNKFNFLFKLKEKELKIELTSNKKYFKNIKKNEMGSFGNFSFGSLTTGSNMGTGDFDFSGNWNGTFKDDKNDTFYDIYNSIPLAEYLSY